MLKSCILGKKYLTCEQISLGIAPPSLIFRSSWPFNSYDTENSFIKSVKVSYISGLSYRIPFLLSSATVMKFSKISMKLLTAQIQSTVFESSTRRMWPCEVLKKALQNCPIFDFSNFYFKIFRMLWQALSSDF